MTAAKQLQTNSLLCPSRITDEVSRSSARDYYLDEDVLPAATYKQENEDAKVNGKLFIMGSQRTSYTP